MSRYRVVIIGTGMNVPPEGVAGFATTRFVHATTAELAAQEAIRQVADAAASEPAFQSSPQPTLSVDLVTRVWSPFKRSEPNSGYSFFDQDDGPASILDIERAAGSGWW